MARAAPREYQDPEFVNWRHEDIPAELAAVRPRGDFVLLRVLPEDALEGGRIWIPQSTRERGKQPPRIGFVVAVGKGDRLFSLFCPFCRQFTARTETARSWRCRECGETMRQRTTTDGTETGRCEMNVKPGDRVLYWRVPANGVKLNGEEFVFVHEQQHIVAVLEDEDQKHGKSKVA